eukprot:CAMPEP_0172526094 /NCGR_PEP_ID=MMETSP1067-20121228/1094_1 /TAXON_ID=265564 ORGANISM="Thalassiosira punctigera, Strain Tpunct2005C2" /NCGR_SAMPLE_ID=MMETSP1067 /ASSEMBLY_ACC=CAM_ASM_000444 /LENGTH=1314 /DNA_ID=CAMNT_0013309531 /DNA_START=85 /DNA_END=4029 /DNA_ORIENTATION=-
MTHHSNSSDSLFPLRKWIEREALNDQISGQPIAGFGDAKEKRDMILRKTIIAYGMTELLAHSRAHHSIAPSPSVCEQFSLDNFAIRFSFSDVAEAAAGASGQYYLPGWKDITGVDMISPPISMNILEPSYLCDNDGGDVEDQIVGRYLEVEFPIFPDADGTAFAVSQSEEDVRCHSLGIILYELFSHIAPLPDEGRAGVKKCSIKEDGPTTQLNNDFSRESAHQRKKTKLSDYTAFVTKENTFGHQAVEESQETPCSAFQRTPYFPLIELRFPSSVCLLIRNLLECQSDNDNRPDDAYDSLETVSKDLHLLLLDPNRFLFDRKPTPENGYIQLMYRKHKLYGRENEVSKMTDAFCRVSGGKSEAFFIGGFSGSGKSRLVNSLTARVDVSDGYVITHKFDQISKERPLLEIILVFNDLCLLVRKKRSQHDLLAIFNELMEVFGADFSMLAQLLPNIEAISPNLDRSNHAKEVGDRMNFRSVCFILQRFMRVVSTKSHPVMLFLDDIQWCDDSALSLIEGIICGGSSCLFFVGSYRSNEVRDNHALFSLIDGLNSSGVPTTKMSLEGLTPDDLNTMISDAMCMFPRICENLSDIVFQKTKGNPFFVLEFLRSLVDGALLEYSAKKRRWIWDEDRISAMDVMGNVLALLSSKMSGLSESTQQFLKVASCFGIRMKESVVEYLSKSPEYSSIQSGLEHAIAEGFMIKVETSDFKFVHDKVREAAYILIPDSEKNEFHYGLGMTLYLITNGSDVDDIIFSIADQVKYGIDHSLVQSPELRLDLAKLNQMAGIKAAECSDHSTARSYLNVALSLLPTDHWKSHYDRSLRLCFLLAKSAYSCGDVEKAHVILKEILNNAHCLMDKLDAYHLVVLIMYDKEATEEAYTTVRDVLTQLGETIPNVFSLQETKVMTETTSKMLSSISEESLLGMEEMEGKSQFLLKFYSSISVVALVYKPDMVPYFSCRMVQLTMQHGKCKHSLLGFVQYAAVGCGHNTVTVIQEFCRIGKLAMNVLKHFDSRADIVSRLYLIYYAFVASYSEQIQSSVNNLHRGFECGMASGDTSSGFLNAIHNIRISLNAGIDLPTIFKKIEYFLEVMKSHGNSLAMTHLSLHRNTISILIGKTCNDYTEVQNSALKFPASLYHKAVRAFWIGHSERCHHFFEKFDGGGKINDSWGSRHQRNFYVLYYGLNALKIIRRTSPHKMKAVPRSALKALKIFAGCSRWNFQNKVHLLEAGIFSHEGRNAEAKASYAAAITSARSSRFIHEQGLACEMAGFHYKKIGDYISARAFFVQAKECYAQWGSDVKVDSITNQLEILQTPSA